MSGQAERQRLTALESETRGLHEMIRMLTTTVELLQKRLTQLDEQKADKYKWLREKPGEVPC